MMLPELIFQIRSFNIYAIMLPLVPASLIYCIAISCSYFVHI